MTDLSDWDVYVYGGVSACNNCYSLSIADILYDFDFVLLRTHEIDLLQRNSF